MNPSICTPGRIYDIWTAEDYQRYKRLNLARARIVVSMVRNGDRPDADLMRLWSLLRDEFGHGVYVINRNAVVEAEAL